MFRGKDHKEEIEKNLICNVLKLSSSWEIKYKSFVSYALTYPYLAFVQTRIKVTSKNKSI